MGPTLISRARNISIAVPAVLSLSDNCLTVGAIGMVLEIEA